MKKTDLEKILKKLGAGFLREGGSHEVWISKSGKKFTIPRHREINEVTAKKILKQAGA
jgi:mRNA interferase HicA